LKLKETFTTCDVYDVTDRFKNTVEYSFLFPLVQAVLKFVQKHGCYSPK